MLSVFVAACGASDSGADGAAPGLSAGGGSLGAGKGGAGVGGPAAGGAGTGGAPKAGSGGAAAAGKAGTAGTGGSSGGAAGAGKGGSGGATSGSGGAAGGSGGSGSGGAPYPPSICAGLTLDGAAARAVAPWVSPYDVSGAVTVEVWVEPLTVPIGAAAPIVVHWDGATDTASYGLFLQPSGKAAFFVSSNGAATVGVSSTKPLKTGVMQHLAGVFDSSGKALRLYVDGVQDATLPVTFSAPKAVVGAPLSLGNFASPTVAQPSLFGTIASVRVSSSARYSAPFVPEYPLVPDLATFASFKLDVELSSTVLDASSSSNAAQLLGNAKIGKPASCSTGAGGASGAGGAAGKSGASGAGAGGSAGKSGASGAGAGGSSGASGAGGSGAAGSSGASGAGGAGTGGSVGAAGSSASSGT